MRNRLVFGAIVAMCVAGAAGMASLRAEQPKVAICHFGGHDGDYPLRSGLGKDCAREGGVEITIAQAACINGHGLREKECERH